MLYKDSVRTAQWTHSIHLGYKNQSFNVLYGKICCLLQDLYKTQIPRDHNLEFLNVKPCDM